MSMHTYLINIINDLNDQNQRLKAIETGSTDTSSITTSITNLQNSKQNLITVLTPLICYNITCTDIKLNNIWLNTRLTALESKDDYFTAYNASKDVYYMNNINGLSSTVTTLGLLKQNKITESTEIVCSTITCNDVIISGVPLTSDLSLMKETTNNVSRKVESLEGYVQETVIEMFEAHDFSMVGIHTIDRENFTTFITAIPANINTNFCSFKFIPKHKNSRFNCKFNCTYRFSGVSPAGSDISVSYCQIFQGGAMIYQSAGNTQMWMSSLGGGTRSGVMFPLNWTIRPRLYNVISEITVLIYINNASDDPIAVSANDSAFFECTEIRCFTALELSLMS